MKIAYIGPKDTKIDRVSGSRLVFPRFDPLEVEKEHALLLLRFPDVFVEEKDLAVAKKRIEEKEAEALAKAEAEVAAQEKEVADASRVIEMDGKKVDLRKYTEAKLKTLVEACDLVVEPKQATEKVADYCDRVYEAYQS